MEFCKSNQILFSCEVLIYCDIGNNYAASFLLGKGTIIHGKYDKHSNRFSTGNSEMDVYINANLDCFEFLPLYAKLNDSYKMLLDAVAHNYTVYVTLHNLPELYQLTLHEHSYMIVGNSTSHIIGYDAQRFEITPEAYFCTWARENKLKLARIQM